MSCEAEAQRLGNIMFFYCGIAVLLRKRAIFLLQFFILQEVGSVDAGGPGKNLIIYICPNFTGRYL